jgi:choline dehydrogenase
VVRANDGGHVLGDSRSDDREMIYEGEAVEYDYAVIGAGSAGCVLANRLSADPDRSVLLLEAGASNRHPNVLIPAAFAKLFRTKRDWGFRSDPDPNLEGRELYMPRGKMLGGSSSMNAMIYIRGRRADYDAWEAAGCTGWGYAGILPYFIRSEHNDRIRDEFHGSDGELDVADPRSPNRLSEAFVEACVEWGLAPNDDFNGASQLGAGLFQLTQRRGRRWSAADAFLKPAAKRPNLEITTRAHVTRIVIEGARAAAVEYRLGSKTHRIRVRREVVVSAGALNSPQLLMLSGIGPAEHLRSHGIEPKVDLPAGLGLQDHPAILTAFDSASDIGIDDAESLRYLPDYVLRRRGKLTSNVAEAGAFFKTNAALDVADIQFHFAPAYFNNHGFTTRDGFAMTIGPTLVSPRSRGRVLLRSGDPAAPIRVEGNYLSHREEIVSLIAGVRAARDVAGQAALSECRGAEIHPGPEVMTDTEIEAYIRHVAEMLYHPVGTCAMGPAGTAVVDPELRVNGIEGLRVADASIMPTIVGGNTNAAVIMIAEKAADLILG